MMKVFTKKYVFTACFFATLKSGEETVKISANP